MPGLLAPHESSPGASNPHRNSPSTHAVLPAATLTQVLHITAKDMSITASAMTVLTLLTSMQLLLFPMAALARALPISDPSFTSSYHVLSVLNASRISNYIDMPWYTAVAVLTLLWLALVCGLTLAVGARMLSHHPQSRRSLRLLRALFKTSVTVLFMPFSGIALSWFNCSDESSLVPGQCWGPFHATLAAGYALTLPVFIVISIVVALLYIERDMTGTGRVGAQTDGRGEVALLILKLCLTASFTALSTVITNGVQLAMIIAVSVLTLYMFVLQQPHYYARINYLRAGFAGVYTWLSIAALGANLSDQFAVNWLLILGTIPCGIAMAAVAHLRRNAIIHARLSELRSARHVVLWAASRAQAAVILRSAGSGFLISGRSSASGTDGKPGATGDALSDQIVTVPFGNMTLLQPMARADAVTELLYQAEQGFRAIISQHARSVVGMLAAAAFFGNVDLFPSRFLELTALSQLHSGHNSIDVAFAVYRRTRTLREHHSTSSSRQSLSTVDRVMLEQHMQAAAQAQVQCFRARAAMYAELSKSKPDLNVLQQLADKLWRAVHRTRREFEAALSITNENAQVLRRYAAFASTVCGDTSTAAELASRAEQVESFSHTAKTVLQMFEFGSESPAFSPDDPATAMITSSGDAAIMGRMIGVNAAGCRMLGYSRNALLGRDVSMLMPQSIGSVHHEFLARFAKNGHGQPWLMGGTARNLFAVDARGRLIAVRALLSEVLPDSKQISPAFVMSMQALELAPSLILMERIGHQWRVEHMCASSEAALYPHDADTLADPSRKVRTGAFFVPELDIVHFFTSILGVTLKALAIDGAGSKASDSASLYDAGSQVPSFADEAEASPRHSPDDPAHERNWIMAVQELIHRLRVKESALHQQLEIYGISTGQAIRMLKRATEQSFQQAALKGWHRTSVLSVGAGSIDADVKLQEVQLPGVRPLLLVQWRYHATRNTRTPRRASQAHATPTQPAQLNDNARLPAMSPPTGMLSPRLPMGSPRFSPMAGLQEDNESSEGEHIGERDSDEEAQYDSRDDTPRASPAQGSGFATGETPTAALTTDKLTLVGAGLTEEEIDMTPNSGDGKQPAPEQGQRESASRPRPDAGTAVRFDQLHVDTQPTQHEDQQVLLRTQSFTDSLAKRLPERALSTSSAGGYSIAMSAASGHPKVLRKAVFMQSAKSETSVHNIKRVLLGMSIVVALSAGVLLALNLPLYDRLYTSLFTVYYAGERARNAYGAFQAVAVLAAIPASDARLAGLYNVSHTKLPERFTGFTDAQESIMRSCPTCNVDQVLTVQDEGETRELSSLTSTSIWLSHLLKAVQSELSKGQLTMQSGHVRAVLDNLPNTVNPALYKAVSVYLRALHSDIDSMWTQNLVAFSLLFSTLMLGSATLLGTEARQMTNQRTKVLQLLLLLPKHVVQVLRSDSDRELQSALRKHMRQGEDGELSDSDDLSEGMAQYDGSMLGQPDNVGLELGAPAKSVSMKQREFVDSGRFTAMAIAQLMTPLGLVFLWLMALFLSSTLALQTASSAAARVFLLQDAAVRAAKAHQDLLATMGPMSTNITLAGMRGYQQQAGQSAQASLAALEWVIHGMPTDPLLGEPLDGLSVDDSAWAILMKNSCPLAIDPTACTTEDEGAWSMGLMAGMQSFVTNVLALRTSLGEQQANVTESQLAQLTLVDSLSDDTALEEYRAISNAEQVYLSTILHKIAEGWHADAQTTVDNMKLREIWLSSGAVVAFVVAIVGFFRRAAERLAERISSARALVMMLPDSVIAQNAALQASLHDVMHDMTASHKAARRALPAWQIQRGSANHTSDS